MKINFRMNFCIQIKSFANLISVTTVSPVESILKQEQLNNSTIVSPVSNFIFYLLNNLSNTESEQLDRYLREKNYASLKNMIDRKRAEVS